MSWNEAQIPVLEACQSQSDFEIFNYMPLTIMTEIEMVITRIK